MEIPIVTTSIVGVTNDLQGFSESSWLTTAYLLTYVGRLAHCTLVASSANHTARFLDNMGKAQRYLRKEVVC